MFGGSGPGTVATPVVLIERFVGIDFSGASRAGDSIWLAEASLQGDVVQIEECRPASRLPASGSAREQCLPALVDYIGRQQGVLVGCDFPFSLPERMIGASTWRQFVLQFGKRFPDSDAFLADCRRRGNGREVKRVCDRHSRVPFAAYNLRIYRQTFHGIKDVLAPLVARNGACVLPMQAPRPGRPWIIETCPASTLKRLGLYMSYKGADAAHRAARGRIIDGLSDKKLMARLGTSLARVALDNTGGDALDSMIAAAATALAYRIGEFDEDRTTSLDRIEGRVYF